MNIIVAVEINSIDDNARSSENINKNSVCEVLRLIRRNQNEKKIYFIFDGAASNRSKKITINRYFEEFDDFLKKMMEFFRENRNYKSELKILLTDNF